MSPTDWLISLGLGPGEWDDRFPHWGSRTPAWGDTQTCLAVHEDELVGVSWFLWRDAPAGDLWQAADHLRHAFRERYGPCADGHGRPSGYRCHWIEGGRRLELCAVLEPTAGPREVQVHVTDLQH